MSRLLPLLSIALFACSPKEPASTPPESQQPTQGATADHATIQKNGDPAVDALADFVATQEIDRSKSDWRTRLPKPPQVTFAAGKSYIWNLETSKGPLRIKLRPDAAPMHVSSTIYLTAIGFYDGLTFHRVIPGFMAQGGCPLGTGSGGPGYQYDGEFLVHCLNPECGKDFMGKETVEFGDKKFFVCPHCGKNSKPLLTHDTPGLLSMAHAGPGTDGSQFFITFKPQPGLDGVHTVFGALVRGVDTLDKLERAGTRGGPPTERLEITKATIVIE